eukprot:TRINITY_DN1288_c1_g1_i5.p1 TRINITY_DN1288_c1_g1~~TRINITY_DN1288_c1_g1_i5.p1  ORF type:complete len:187 (+),score=23.44 TRINITY_DN1288_c1_g1_i5:134-694(+)
MNYQGYGAPMPQQYNHSQQVQQQMWQWYSYVDKDKSGKIDYRELKDALAQAGLAFSIMSVQMLLRLFDATKTDNLNFQEFQNLYGWVQQKQQSFFHFDRDRSGFLDVAEVFNALKHAGYALDQHAFYSCIRTYDPDRNGKLSMTEYVGLCAFLQITYNTFAAFDTQRTGRVNLDLNQFVYSVAQCK